MTSRKLAKIGISQEFFVEIATVGWASPYDEMIMCTKGLPDGAELIGSYYDERRMVGYLIFTHDSFSPVDESMEIPDIYVEFTRLVKETDDRA